MFRIGDFSKLSRVPVKTLRYYDEIGLFKPSVIDHYTRYRYYSVEQLAALYRILGLKELGFSLEQIARLLSGDLTPQQLKRMLYQRKRQVEQEVQAARTQLAQLEARIHQLEREGCLPYKEVLLKEAKAQWVAATQGRLTGYEQAGEVFDKLFARLHAFLKANQLEPAGPAFAIYPETEEDEESTRVEAGLPLLLPAKSSGEVRVYQLPAVAQLASVLHQGSLATIGEAYEAAFSWMQLHGYQECGPVREVYLRFDPAGPERCIIEVQFPVMKVKEEYKIMEPKIVHLEAFKVVGMRYFGKNENQEIGELWGEFVPRIPEIRHLSAEKRISYGVCSEGFEDGFEYIAGLPVSRLEDIPAGMVGKEVPAQTYAVFEVHGVKEVGRTYQYILEQWLPNSGYQAGGGPDFEFYPETFDEEEDPESLLYIYYPVMEPLKV